MMTAITPHKTCAAVEQAVARHFIKFEFNGLPIFGNLVKVYFQKHSFNLSNLNLQASARPPRNHYPSDPSTVARCPPYGCVLGFGQMSADLFSPSNAAEQMSRSTRTNLYVLNASIVPFTQEKS
jgi:hypothetical protein